MREIVVESGRCRKFPLLRTANERARMRMGAAKVGSGRKKEKWPRKRMRMNTAARRPHQKEEAVASRRVNRVKVKCALLSFSPPPPFHCFFLSWQIQGRLSNDVRRDLLYGHDKGMGPGLIGPFPQLSKWGTKSSWVLFIVSLLTSTVVAAKQGRLRTGQKWCY